MDLRDITVVFQGAFSAHLGEDRIDFNDNIKSLRKILPGVKIILSTWEGTYVPEKFKFDEIVYSKDPGGLNGIKRKEVDKANNINRQIISTYNGLRAVNTTYALKLRTDCSLEHAGFIDYFKKFNKGEERFVACCFFTIDPEVYEHMPFHISDWFQFGKTETLLKYWDVSLMEKEEAAWYLNNEYDKSSSYFDKEFLSKFAVEQYLAINYAKRFGYITPSYHNDDAELVLDSHRRFLAKQVIVLDPWQIGLSFPKYRWAYSSKFSSMNCIMFLDWYKNYVECENIKSPDLGLLSVANERIKKKNKLKRLINLIEPIADYWYPSKLRRWLIRIVMKFTKLL